MVRDSRQLLARRKKRLRRRASSSSQSDLPPNRHREVKNRISSSPAVPQIAPPPPHRHLRQIHLELASLYGTVEITLLRSIQWIEENNVHPGEFFYLDMPEMGAVGDAQVLSIEPSPPIDEGEGGIVTGTFKHTSGEVYDLKLESESEPMGVTASHPFWSVDRNDWVSVVDLEIGETLKTLGGTTIVEARKKRRIPEPVYNIEVEGDHVYRAGESGVLVHNSSTPCDSRPSKDAGSGSFRFTSATQFVRRNRGVRCRGGNTLKAPTASTTRATLYYTIDGGPLRSHSVVGDRRRHAEIKLAEFARGRSGLIAVRLDIERDYCGDTCRGAIEEIPSCGLLHCFIAESGGYGPAWHGDEYFDRISNLVDGYTNLGMSIWHEDC